MRIGCNPDRYTVHNFQTIPAECGAFLGVITDEIDLADIQVTQNLRANAIIPLVHRKPEVQVGFYSVHAGFLQFVCFEFIEQADTPAFLVHI